MDLLFDEALAPDHIRRQDSLARSIDWLLELRGHSLRMPFYLLLPHLARKAYRQWQVVEEQAPAPGLLAQGQAKEGPIPPQR